MRTSLLRAANNTIFWLSVLFTGFLTVVSLFATTYFTEESSFAERPAYRMDNIAVNLLFLILTGFILSVIDQKLIRKKMSGRPFPMKALAAAAVLFVIGTSIIWINISHTYPEADQKAVSWVAYLLTQDNFLFFEHGKYMQIYPNQLGLTAILEALYRLTGGENWQAFMYLTALANGAVVYLLYKITDKLFQSRGADCLVLIGGAGCVQLTLYTTFLYGITLGLAFALAAFYTLLIYLERRSLKWALLSGVLIGISVLVKNNYSIFLVAMLILLIYKAIDQKRLKNLLAAALLILLTALLSRGLTAFYEARSGLEIGNGMPKTLWIAMGMQEGERAEGWYNAFNFDTFVETDCDEEISDAIAREAIAESLQRFGSDPLYAIRFYYKKTVSQWNEPTYEALWVNQFHSGDFSRLVQSIYEGKLYTVLQEYMNLYQLLVFGAVLFGLIRRRGSWSMEKLFLPLVILGGFFFHTIWEAKSQYIFPYFVCMLPCAAAGLWEFLRKRRNSDQ